MKLDQEEHETHINSTDLRRIVVIGAEFPLVLALSLANDSKVALFRALPQTSWRLHAKSFQGFLHNSYNLPTPALLLTLAATSLAAVASTPSSAKLLRKSVALPLQSPLLVSWLAWQVRPSGLLHAAPLSVTAYSRSTPSSMGLVTDSKTLPSAKTRPFSSAAMENAWPVLSYQ